MSLLIKLLGRRRLASGSLGRETGVALLEVAVSVLVISIGVLGLAGIQISAKRSGYEAVQRTTASALAHDIIERMRSNPMVLDRFDAKVAGVGGNITAAGSCTTTTPPSTPLCADTAFADWDLWEWEQAISGASETDPNDVAVGGLVQATGCIEVDDGSVQVTISWEGYLEMSAVNTANECGDETSLRRQLLVVNTFITDGE